MAELPDARDVVADGLVTIPEAAEFLRISRTGLYKLMNQGALPYVKIGRSRRIPRRAVVNLVASVLVDSGSCGG